MSSRFVKHEPCPKCGSRNNLGVFDDGHKWCFGCHYFVPGKTSINSMREYIAKRREDEMGGQVDEAVLERDSTDYTLHLPANAVRWLRKYSITDGEIKHYKLMLNERTESLVFPVFDNAYRVVVTNERYFGVDKDHPKYITRGPKSLYGNIFGGGHSSSLLIAVEDMVSAIRVGRSYHSVALLGSDLPASRAIGFAKQFNNLRVWLDRDKASEAVVAASRASQYGFISSRAIITNLDPKEYQDQAIKQIVEETIPKEPT